MLSCRWRDARGRERWRRKGEGRGYGVVARERGRIREGERDGVQWGRGEKKEGSREVARGDGDEERRWVL